MVPISRSEKELMQVLWAQEEPMTAAQIAQCLLEERWKPTTILTFLSRLTAKGMVRAARQGRYNYYTALVSEPSYRASLTRQFLQEVHGGSFKSLIESISSCDDLKPEELEELKCWIFTQTEAPQKF